MIDGDHAHRLGQDHYTFLGIPRDAEPELVDQAFARLVKRWRMVERNAELPEPQRAKATELVAAAKAARRVLGGAARRAAYDQTLEGVAPSAGDTPSVAGDASGGSGSGAGLTVDSLARARELLADGSFRLALPLLKQARLDDPSSPEVLAALGWATWKTQGQEAAQDAVDYLKLALTFDKRAMRALEYLARIFLEQEDAERARPVLKRFLKHQPRAQWAKDALGSLPEPAAEAPEAADKGRFWRKGSPG
jgi:curved DNA-binding protein CbpA